MTSPLPYRERLSPALWLILASALLLPAVFLILLPVDPVLAAIVSVIVYGLVLVGLFTVSPEITVVDGVLRAGRASIPVTALGEATAFEGEEAFLERGQRLDARAWLMIRGWVGPVVRIELRDESDPAPYWLLSTRRPQELVAALQAARSAT